ncbi:MAG: two-component sensor histidine kinase [Ponticaulis sp.]|nr:two-component sensor histidine kinase [Ponticaulis sp.]|tara:strand:- start:14654 stop:16000 length:1347 start_codon:yes stop_codon:yes gene_type:complete
MLRFRDITPRGFYARILLIVLLPLVLLLIAMTWFFFDSHIAEINRKLSQSVAGEVAEVARKFQDPAMEAPTPEQIAAISTTLRLEVEVLETDEMPVQEPPGWWRTSRSRVLDHELAASLMGTDYWFDTDANPDQVEVRVLTGHPAAPQLRFLVDRKRVFATTGHNFIVWVLLFSLLLIAVSIGFLRNQVRSVLKLAAAAEAWGRGEDIGQLRPSGATEVRKAARAISQMRERIIAYADQRTAMLAGVSHDLRTPLTRLKLQLALLPDSPDKDAAKDDLDDMSAMLDEYLAFAKGQEGENYEETDIGVLAHDVALSFAEKADVSVNSLPGIRLRVRPLAVKRALSNLINNAADHGDHVFVTVSNTNDAVTVLVEDDGPGIEEDRIEDAFKPFVRLDEARSQNRTGVGLGLALARDVARSHGGDILLSRSGHGGLCAAFQIPLQLLNMPD